MILIQSMVIRENVHTRLSKDSVLACVNFVIGASLDLFFLIHYFKRKYILVSRINDLCVTQIAQLEALTRHIHINNLKLRNNVNLGKLLMVFKYLWM